MRTCAKCGLIKPIDDFYRLRAGQEARQSRCKACDAQSYRERRQRDLKIARRNERERHRGLVRQPRSPQYLEHQRIHARNRYYACKPMSLARCAVRDAVRRAQKWASNQLKTRQNIGPLLFRPPFCPWCGRRATIPIEAHHFMGYDRQHRLSGIILVCRSCHREIDVQMREALLDHLPPIEGFKRFLREHGLQSKKIFRAIDQKPERDGYNDQGQPPTKNAKQGDHQHAV